ncbi:MAG TPA: ROK family protein, partial [Thermomicrobiaceae bacterium]|nr:ROK family protein [Thermomicrobiaceae bacterium]
MVGRARSIDAAVPASVALQIVRGLIDQACLHAGVALEQVARIGVAFGGPVDVDRGLTLLSHRAPGFDDFPIVNLLEEQLQIPVLLDNSARAATMGEAWYGAARGAKDVIYVHLGTGVGGGFIVDGRLVQGTSGTAGE